MNRNRFLMILSLIVLATLASGAVSSKSFTTQTAQAAQAEDRILKKRTLPNEPLEIFNIKVGGKEISFGQKFTADVEWARGLTFDIKNISGRVLTHLRLYLLLQDPDGKKPMSLAPLFWYGSDTTQPDAKPTVRMMPGEVLQVAYTDNFYEWFKRMRNLVGLASMKEVMLQIDVVMFDDDTMWRNGYDLRRDPSNPTRWLVISREPVAKQPKQQILNHGQQKDEPVQPSQTAESKFDPSRNAEQDIQAAKTEAQRTHKRIILDVGGEWCSWCHALDRFYADHADLSAYREKNYVWLKVNSSPENPNKEVLSRYPAAKGFPHLFVLDQDGKLLQSQETSPLEEGKSYNLERMFEFLKKWAPPSQ